MNEKEIKAAVSNFVDYLIDNEYFDKADAADDLQEMIEDFIAAYKVDPRLIEDFIAAYKVDPRIINLLRDISDR